MADFAQFATDVLKGLGVPVTPQNITFIETWASKEGGGGANNPLNTTLAMPGATVLAGNSAGVKNYGSYQQGVQATVQTLQSGLYSDIRSGLASGHADPAAQYTGLSHWSGGGGALNPPAGHGYSTLNGTAATNRQVSAQAAAGAAAGTTAPATTQQYDEQSLAQQFGYQAAFFNTDPSLKQWMDQALTGTFGDISTSIGNSKATSALHATKWWQQHTDAQRKWNQQLTSDPATANRQISDRTQDVLRLAVQEGATVDGNTARQIAKSALANGMDDAHLKDMVDAHVVFHRGVAFGGQAGQLADQYRQLAADYGQQPNEDTIASWVVHGMQGKSTDQDFANYVKQSAISRYPGLADQINQGITVKQAADPYVQSYANLLEQDPTTVDWQKDPLIQQALQFRPAPTGTGASSSGSPTTMPLWQFEQSVRKDPRWDLTDNARNSMLSALGTVGKDWGFV